jgi:hypothetical protein
MSTHPLLQIKILGIAFACEIAFMSYFTPQWVDVIRPLLSLSGPGVGMLGGW